MSDADRKDDTMSASTSDAGPVVQTISGSELPVEERPRKVYKQLALPNPEQIMQEDFMNNCAVRTVMSGVMGAGLGAVFGVVMGSMDTGVRRWLYVVLLYAR